MINFYCGNTLSGCADKMLADAAATDGKRKTLIIVPDRFTLCTELSYLALTKGTYSAEISGFSRLASKVLEGKINKCLSPDGAVMLMTRTIQGCRDELKCYAGAARTAGFASELFAGISAIRASGISWEDLEKCAEGLNGYLRNKTLDIALIYKRYLAELMNSYTDSTSRLEAFRDSITEGTVLADYDIYISDFYAYTGIQYDIIGRLMKYARSVSIGVINNIDCGNSRIFPSKVAAKLRGLAALSSVPTVDIDASVPLTAAGEMIEKQLFGYDNVTSLPTDAIFVYKAASDDEELSLVCTEIIRQVRSEGLRYRDIAVVLGDALGYRPVVKRVFARYGIPYFTDDRQLLSFEPLTQAVLCWLRMFIERFSLASVCEYLKTPFSGVTPRDAEIFENYCLKYSQEYGFNHSFARALDNEEKVRQDVAEQVRQKLNAAREGYEELESAATRMTARQYYKILTSYMQNANYQTALTALYEAQKIGGYKDAAARSLQVSERLFAVLENAAELIGGVPLSLKEYYELIKSGADSSKIAIIPQTGDCVYVGEGEDSRYDNIKVLFIVGASENVFPKSAPDDGILTDRDYDAWAKNAIRVFPTNKEQRTYGRFYAEQLLLCPNKKLFIGHSVRGADGSSVNPSIIIERLKAMFSLTEYDAGQLLSRSKEEGGVYTLAELTATPENACKRVIDGVRAYRRGAERNATLAAIYNSLPMEYRRRVDRVISNDMQAPDNPARLFFDGGITSVSQLECYFSCPFKHYVRYGLRAKEREEGELEKKDTGNFIHEFLECFFKENDVKALTKAQAVEIGEKLVDRLLADPLYSAFSEGSQRGRIKTLKAECVQIGCDLSQLTARSDYVPTEFEVKFGGKGKYRGLPLKDGTELSGKIDRIDYLNGKDAVVVDYKTGMIESDLKYVYYGVKIQLYVYLKALSAANKKPVGAFYLPIKANYVSAADSDYKYCCKGQVLNDVNTIQSLDRELKPGQKSPVIPVALKNNGEPKKSVNTLLSEEDFAAVMDYTERLSDNAVAEIKSGYSEPSPVDRTCDFCEFRNICGYSSELLGTRKVTSVGREVFGGQEDEDRE